MIKHRAKAHIITIMVLNMKDHGNKISSMDMGIRHGQIIADMKDITKWVKKVGKGNTHGKTIVLMKENGLITK